MSAQSLPKDLLEQAEFLANREPKRPKQASLRRAVSTSYYALFHLLNAEAVALLAPNVDEQTQHRMRRWFDHSVMKEICGRFLPSNLSSPLKELIGTSASSDLQLVARNFITLQEARHQADYDTSLAFTRTQAQALIQQAQDAFESWQRIRKTSEANVFILSLVLWKNWEKRP